MIDKISDDELKHAFKTERKPEVVERQKLDVRYHIENPVVEGRAQKFLEAFAAILKNTNYGFVLDQYVRSSAKCSRWRCATECQIYQATRDPRDIPCYRSELLLSVYRRHFTVGGLWKGRLFGRGFLTDEKVNEMAESFWNCTACRRCSLQCPVGIDHGLVTHLGRYILSEIGIEPRAPRPSRSRPFWIRSNFWKRICSRRKGSRSNSRLMLKIANISSFPRFPTS